MANPNNEDAETISSNMIKHDTENNNPNSMMQTTRKSSTDASQSAVNPVIQNIYPRTFYGCLASANASSMDWSWNGLIAFGAQDIVIIAETRSASSKLKLVQTLDRHKYVVSRCKWVDNYADLKLATCDIGGTIIIWDVNEASVLAIISGDNVNKTVREMKWIRHRLKTGQTVDYLLVLYSSYCLVLYDTEVGDAIWKKTYTGLCPKSFSLDPFDPTNLLLTPSSLTAESYFVIFKDLNATRPISESSAVKYLLQYTGSDSPVSSSRIKQKTKFTFQSAKYEIPSHAANVKSASSNAEYIDAIFSRSTRNQVFISFDREILLVDLSLELIISRIAIEKNSSNIWKFYPCWQRNALVTLHESGHVSMRLQKKEIIDDDHLQTELVDINYETLCQSENIRLTKHNKIHGFAVSPVDECRFAVLTSNGKLLIKELFSAQNGHSICSIPTVPKSLSSLLPMNSYDSTTSVKLKMIVTNISSGLNHPPYVLRMCPPVTLRNWPFYRPLLAIGDSSGQVIIANLATGVIERELGLHSGPVRGIEWAALDSFLSFSYPNPAPSASLTKEPASSKTINELRLNQIDSGQSISIREEKNRDSSPIEMLRVSHLKQYFIISFKEEPFEIWDLKKLVLLRVMPKQFSNITALEWSPLYNKPQQARQMSEGGDASTDRPSEDAPSKENFVVTSSSGELFHFSIQNTLVKEVSRIPPDSSMTGPILSIAWKSDTVILGDSEGNLNVWDLKRKISRVEPTHRGPIKKIRFAPGRGNMKAFVLYSDGVEIWDAKEFKMSAQLKHPRDIHFKINDIDWAGSDRPLMSNSDGFVVVTDLKLKMFTATITELLSEDPDLVDNEEDATKVNPHCLPSLNQYIVRAKMIHSEGSSITDLDHIGHQITDEGAVPDLNRYLQVAQLFGDQDGVHFWTIASHYLDKEGPNRLLDSLYEPYFPRKQFREYQLERVALLEARKSSYLQSRKCCDYHLFLGHHQRAVQLLLETDPAIEDGTTYYMDSLKACLIAALHSDSSENNSLAAAHPVIKLVATNLIAHGRVEEGTQLLCLIGKNSDACKYLLSANKWQQAVWLAKANLEENECEDIIKRWLEHLLSQNQLNSALLMLLSMGKLTKVIELLAETDDIEKAALLASYCIKKGHLEVSNNNDPLSTSLISLLKRVFNRYANKLQEVGLNTIANSYKNLLSANPNSSS